MNTPDERETAGGCPHWATDFDHAHPEYNANAETIWAELRGSCPVAHTDRYGGTWLPVRHEDVHRIAYDTENFSSVGVVVSQVRPEWEQSPLGGAPPITSDPPAHQQARRILLPAFSPKAIDPWESEVRALCRELLDRMEAGLGDDGVVDAAVEYAQHIPVNVIARMLGMPLADADRFRGFVHDVLEAVDVDPEQRVASLQALGAYIREQVEEHRVDRREDLIGHLLEQDWNGEPLSEEHIVGTIILLLIAGIDTTWSAIGSAIMHMSANPADRRRVLGEPELLPVAVEELLRAYAPVTMARVVRNDTEIGGVTMHRGDWTLLPFPAANRDPEMFAEPDEVRIDRLENRHAAFGLGIHRCIGSNLARLEMTVALEEFIKRFPDCEPAGKVQWSVGQVRGPRRLPIRVR